jgi:hypothetical protein
MRSRILDLLKLELNINEMKCKKIIKRRITYRKSKYHIMTSFCSLEEIVTGDETWIYHFQPDSKAKISFGFHLRATDLSLRAVVKHQIA